MKNLNTRTVLITLLIAASLSSYFFLMTESTKISNQTPKVEQTEEQAQMVLPDIEVAKKICNVVRAVLHPFQER